ncbi:hypothetical protein ISP17_17075 [Dyella ginsengisoli]|uniref:Uncharacterized protein n=1 Tax=Dyella ginsengisoli TaxID=363848 RepID=A0ABW8JWY0_9GAMM
MSWEPGQAVLSASDYAEWQAWRKARKLEQQRDRRAMYARIDYYPSDEALRVIGARRGDYSSVIDALVLDSAGEVPE